MYKYVKFNEDSGLCTEVGMGTNTEFYKSIGMVEKDVEQSEVDSQWYLVEKCPHYTEEEILEKKRSELSNKLKAKRNNDLTDTDFYLMPDYPISEENLNLIKSYRQALRDLPQQEGFPYVEYPVNPLKETTNE